MYKELLLKKISKSDWWHVPPSDPNAYKNRGKFLASTYKQAEFYGRPNDKPERVELKNPLYGFSELEILTHLFGKVEAERVLEFLNKDSINWYMERIEIDARMHDRAKSLGYDAIVLMSEHGRRSLQRKRKPNSIELNIICK